MGIGLLAVGVFATSQGVVAVDQTVERRTLIARAVADSMRTGKPVMIVGEPHHVWDHGCAPPGGTTLDLDPRVASLCPDTALVADVRHIPEVDGTYAAVVVSHVLEHLHSLDDVAAAWSELHRVADHVYIAYPRKGGVWNWMMADHHLWTTPHGDMLEVEEREPPRRHALVAADGAVTMLGKAD